MVVITGKGLTIHDVVRVSRGFEPVLISSYAARRVEASKKFLDTLLDQGEVPYGVRTGYGKQGNVVIPKERASELSYNILEFLGVAPDYTDCFPEEVSRATTLARLNSLSKGHSGVKLNTVEALRDLLNAQVHPRIPRRGSCGASGDLVPLSYMAKALLGKGDVDYNGQVFSAAQALAHAGLSPITLDAKEGLALVNGTSLMTGIAALAVKDALDLALLGEALTAFCNEVVGGNVEAYDERIHKLRPHPGQIESAHNLRRFSVGSALLEDYHALRAYLQKQADTTVVRTGKYIQPFYALRTAPQVYGGIRDTLDGAFRTVEIELNSVTDNPLLFHSEKEYLQGGNFQGYHISAAMDDLRNRLSAMAKFQEQQFGLIMDPHANTGLPPTMSGTESGLNACYLGAEIAITSLLPRINMLATPISNQSSPTDRPNQNFVSMGAASAAASLEMIGEVGLVSTYLLALLAQAADFKGPDKLGTASRLLYGEVRMHLPFIAKDTCLDKGMHSIYKNLVKTGLLADCLRRL